tara:strand:- start:71 stop:529 length:459 start_codon:yes stop_codon:yes gene_type:complete
MAHYREATRQDVEELSEKMRKADAEEVMASSGLTPIQALTKGFELSKGLSIIHKDELIGMFGVAEVGEDIGSPWMLGSDKIPEIKKDLLTQALDWVIRTNKEYPLLVNYVDVRNKVAIRWLKFLGFSFVRKIPYYGVGRVPFYEFVRIDSNV